MSSPAHCAAAYLARFVATDDPRAKQYAAEILETPAYRDVDVSHFAAPCASAPIGTVSFPALPINEDDQRLVDKIVRENTPQGTKPLNRRSSEAKHDPTPRERLMAYSPGESIAMSAFVSYFPKAPSRARSVVLEMIEEGHIAMNNEGVLTRLRTGEASPDDGKHPPKPLGFNEIRACFCYDCADAPEHGINNPTLSRMFCCPACGNKRCPRATHHRYACTGSNEPGQVGSRYGVEDHREQRSEAASPDASALQALGRLVHAIDSAESWKDLGDDDHFGDCLGDARKLVRGTTIQPRTAEASPDDANDAGFESGLREVLNAIAFQKRVPHSDDFDIAWNAALETIESFCKRSLPRRESARPCDTKGETDASVSNASDDTTGQAVGDASGSRVREVVAHQEAGRVDVDGRDRARLRDPGLGTHAPPEVAAGHKACEACSMEDRLGMRRGSIVSSRHTCEATPMPSEADIEAELRAHERVPSEVHESGWQWRPVSEDTAFAPPFGTIRICTTCGCLVAGGPTRCARCAALVASETAAPSSSSADWWGVGLDDRGRAARMAVYFEKPEAVPRIIELIEGVRRETAETCAAAAERLLLPVRSLTEHGCCEVIDAVLAAPSSGKAGGS